MRFPVSGFLIGNLKIGNLLLIFGYFTDDICRCIFVNEKFCILIKILLKFVPKGPIDNNLAFGLDNGLAPIRRQGIIWTNADAYMWH